MAWGLTSVRQRIARQNPGATPKQRDAMMAAWLDARAGSPGPGERVVTLAEFQRRLRKAQGKKARR